MLRNEKWWWGVIPLALFGIGAYGFQHNQVENDLQKRATETISKMGDIASSLSVEASGRDLILRGMTEEGDEVNAISSQLSSLWGVRKVINQVQLPEEIKPFPFKMSYDGNLKLDGYFSGSSSKKSILDALAGAFRGKSINDMTALGRGKPEAFDETVIALGQQLAKLESGEVSFSGSDITITGKARSAGTKESILSALQQLPAGMKLVKADIISPEPFTFEAVKTDDQLTLKGAVPDEVSRQSLLAAIKQFFFKEKVIDELQINEGAPKEFSQITRAGLRALSRLSSGSFSFGETDAKISGSALYEKAVEGISSELKGALPEGFVLDPKGLQVQAAGGELDQSVCQTHINELLTKTMIHFETDSADISPRSAGLLDQITATLYRCPEAQVEIVGYTDTTGNPEYNQSLSEKRAESVVHYLVSAGLTTERFQAVGRGEENPIASNDTAEGKSLNRRIEFIMK